MDTERALPHDRLTALSPHQETFLTALSVFLATHLFVSAGAGVGAGIVTTAGGAIAAAGAIAIGSSSGITTISGSSTEGGNTHQVVASLEKRSVALRLTVEMVRLSPAEHMPIACSQVLLLT